MGLSSVGSVYPGRRGGEREGVRFRRVREEGDNEIHHLVESKKVWSTTKGEGKGGEGNEGWSRGRKGG